MDRESNSAYPLPQAAALILIFSLISAVFIYLVYSQTFVFGSEAGNWTYHYLTQVRSISFRLAGVIFLFLGLLWVGNKFISGYEKPTLLASFLVAVGIQVFIRRIYPFSMGKIIADDGANSFYTPAMQYSPGQILAKYLSLAPSFPQHASSNLPGKILLFQFLRLFTESTEVMGYLIIAISALGGLLVYGISKRLFQDRTIAFYSLVLYTLIPARLFFFPILNTVTPVLILACMFLLLLYLDSKNKLLLLLLGVLLYIQILFEPSPMVTGFLFVAVLLSAIGRKQISWKELVSLAALPVLGFLFTHLIFRLVFSFDLFAALQYAVRDANEFNALKNRGYWIWIGENLKEFFFAAGLPTMLIFIYLAMVSLTRKDLYKKNILMWPVETLFVLGLLLTLLIVLFLGINRGEVTRLWIYLAVFFTIPAAFFMGKKINRAALFYALAAVLVVQSLVTIQRVGFVLY